MMGRGARQFFIAYLTKPSNINHSLLLGSDPALLRDSSVFVGDSKVELLNIPGDSRHFTFNAAIRNVPRVTSVVNELKMCQEILELVVTPAQLYADLKSFPFVIALFLRSKLVPSNFTSIFLVLKSPTGGARGSVEFPIYFHVKAGHRYSGSFPAFSPPGALAVLL